MYDNEFNIDCTAAQRTLPVDPKHQNSRSKPQKQQQLKKPHQPLLELPLPILNLHLQPSIHDYDPHLLRRYNLFLHYGLLTMEESRHQHSNINPQQQQPQQQQPQLPYVVPYHPIPGSVKQHQTDLSNAAVALITHRPASIEYQQFSNQYATPSRYAPHPQGCQRTHGHGQLNHELPAMYPYHHQPQQQQQQQRHCPTASNRRTQPYPAKSSLALALAIRKTTESSSSSSTSSSSTSLSPAQRSSPTMPLTISSPMGRSAFATVPPRSSLTYTPTDHTGDTMIVDNTDEITTTIPSTDITDIGDATDQADDDEDRTTNIGHLFPELLTMIFERLSVRDRGRAAQVCTLWRDSCYLRSVWRGSEARMHLRRSQQHVYPSLVRRGIRSVQVLSMKRSIRDVIVGMPNLVTLNLSGCYNISDAALATAFSTDCPNLRVLDLSLCKQISDHGLGRIAQNVRGLEVLELGGCCNVSNNGLLLIAWGLRKLKRLNLRSCWVVTDTGIGHLAGLTREADGNLQLEHLGLQDLPSLTDEALRHLATGLTSLQSINLSFCVSVTDSGLKHLAQMPQLRELNLGSCDNISDIGMAYLTGDGYSGDGPESSALTALDVSFCEKIGDPAMVHIAQGLRRLRSLSLNHCQISDEGLTRLARNLQHLETLNIGQCNRITDVGLEAITKELTELSAIDLYGCTMITRKGLDIIMKNPKLKKLNLGLWLVR